MPSPARTREEDDDEFDWEAAVREIDNACNLASVPISTSNTHGFVTPVTLTDPATLCPRSGKGRQSTLDRFVSGSHMPKRARNCFEGRLGSSGHAERELSVVGADDLVSVKIDLEAAKTWIYPMNVPLRDYQFSITRTALFSNTLVVLPTGLGKTLIAAVVMYNYFRWFPEGKIVFAAPSRPLVMQQIEACHNIVGMPQEWTIDMTGQMCPAKRSTFWKTKRVFFVTPQVLEKDIQSGICLVKQLVCFVVDEAHRATGNYSYCVAVRELMTTPVQLRILALTATPGSKQRTVQNVIDNLHISTMEYRNEGDHDVSQYVHNRKLELIQVAMSECASAINNLLSEAKRPYVARLCALGVLQAKDAATYTRIAMLQKLSDGESFRWSVRYKYMLKYEHHSHHHNLRIAREILQHDEGSDYHISKFQFDTPRPMRHWSPCQLLDLRDKFRQAPPSNLHHSKYGEVEGYFGVLITLYHIQKLLSSHGIKPAYDMLEEKLKQGSFARIVTKNENIIRATRSMQQSLAHGAPNPKLVKMTEILLDHFRKHDPKESRVIIFSNFRGSVKHIMDSLSRIGDVVKATEFVGQSTAKTLKGQSQKVQQAVLQKFRSGGYNVIVATSIGEEGLDIMEVDLVICFDANVSPLRMIQRMGRTGRKHDGRVVVLAFEGSEVKGYLHKQAIGKAVRKHMQNGGINSFNFHASPRMVPHVCQPEVQFVELSVEQFIPRGKKTKEDAPNQSPILNNISKEENNLIARYFGQSKTDSWMPSLIAFPSFQSFPSRVHTVSHSSMTTMMLIDTMQRLEELSFSKAKTDLVIEVATSSEFIAGTITSQSISKQDSMEDCNVLINYPKNLVHERTTDVEAPNYETLRDKDMHDVTVLTPPGHTFLFGGDFVSVNSFGSVCILNVPAFPLMNSALSELMRTVRKKEFPVEEKTENVPEVTSSLHAALPPENALELPELAMCIDNPINPGLHSPNDVAEQENGRMKSVFQSPVDQDNVADTLAVKEYNSLLMGKSSTLLSPRLTDFIEKGIVPESPIPSCNVVNMVLVCRSEDDPAMTQQKKMRTDIGSSSSMLLNDVLEQNSLALSPNSPMVTKILRETKLCNTSSNEIDCEKKQSASPLIPEQSPPFNSVSNSSMENWQLSSGSKLVKKAPKYRRLCKYGDKVKHLSCQNLTKYENCILQKSKPSSTKLLQIDCHQGIGKKTRKYLNNFIEEEAEVSADEEASEDEEDGEHDDKYEGSFIDDQTNPAEENSLTENDKSDMLAFYRRSLLTQSPLDTLPLVDSVSSRATESGNHSSEGIVSSLQTPQLDTQSLIHFSGGYSVACRVDSKQNNLVKIRENGSSTRIETSSGLESRKRKLSFNNTCSTPARNFRSNNTVHSEQPSKDMDPGIGSRQAYNDLFCDDEFYQSLDLDAVEAQATELLRYTSRLPIGKTPAAVIDVPSGINQDPHVDQFRNPSFDLGF